MPAPGWTAERDLEEVLKLAEAARIGCATLNTVTQLLDHPQLTQRGRLIEVDSPAGRVMGIAPVPTSRDWNLPLGAIPAVGEHTEKILRELGLELNGGA